MKFSVLAASSLLLACATAAQELPPGTLMLARIKEHMRVELARIPNYTCLETVRRFHRDASEHHPAKLTPLDTVRLEIVYAGGREWYGSPGERSLSTDDPVSFIGSGMIGTGSFAITLSNIFAVATFTYAGEEMADGRKLLHYDFHLPRVAHALRLSVQGGEDQVGEEGSFRADAQSLDLVRLETHAVEIPEDLPVRESSTSVNYERMWIGSQNAMLAQESDMHMVETSGEENFDRLDFTHCRAFAAQSTVNFGVEAQAAEPSSLPPAAPNAAAPPFLMVTVLLATPVTDRDTVGTLIEGRVSGQVRHKGKVAIADGAVVRGRIRRLERFQAAPGANFVVGLEFTEVETSGGPLRFYADLLRIAPTPGIRAELSQYVFTRHGLNGFDPAESRITLPELPGVASFFVSGKSLQIAPGFRMLWRTRGLLH